jgi:hypothetical protein
MSASELKAVFGHAPCHVSRVPIVDTLKPLDHLVVAVWPLFKVLVGKAFVILKKSEAASM